MQRYWLTAFVVTLSACTSSPPVAEPDPAVDAVPAPLPATRHENDAEAAHQARAFYLQGVKLLADPQRVDEAIREFQLALQADPLFYKAHFKLGICYYHKGQYDREIGEYLKCVALNANYGPAQLNLGHAYLARDQLEQARAAYQRVIDLDPENAVALYNLGLLEFDLADFDRSHDYLDRFLRVHNDEGKMGARARMYLKEIRLKKAKAGEGG